MAVPGREARNPQIYDKRERETNPANRPVALQPYNTWDRAHDYTKDGGTDHMKMLKISYADYSKRPARKQVEQADAKRLQAPEGCNEYNIWYDRWIGEQWQQRKELIAAETRCCVRRDAGATKADVRHGEAGYCCVFFARGCCAYGSECSFLHKVPRPEDDKTLSPLRDIFGRERHSSDRDDMRGTGNFNRMNRTLYVGGIKLTRGPEETHKSLLRHFSEWGHIDQLRLIPKKAIAFVTYSYRACAEFALEAMHCQTLDSDDLLNIRWAYDDPNPKAQQLAKERLQDEFLDAMDQAGVTRVEGADFDYPVDYEAPSAKRQRLGEEGSHVAGAYPNTDEQFPAYAYLQDGSVYWPQHESSTQEGGVVGVQSREDAVREEALRQTHEAQSRLASILNAVDTKTVRSAHDDVAASRTWRRLVDAASAREYFYCVETSETVWQLPEGAVLEGEAYGAVSTGQISAEEYARRYGMSVAEARAWLDKYASETGQGQRHGSEVDTNHKAQGGSHEEQEAGEEDEDLAALMQEAENGSDKEGDDKEGEEGSDKEGEGKS